MLPESKLEEIMVGGEDGLGEGKVQWFFLWRRGGGGGAEEGIGYIIFNYCREGIL